MTEKSKCPKNTSGAKIKRVSYHTTWIKCDQCRHIDINGFTALVLDCRLQKLPKLYQLGNAPNVHVGEHYTPYMELILN